MAATIPPSSSSMSSSTAASSSTTTGVGARVPELKTETKTTASSTTTTGGNGATSTRSSSSRPGGNAAATSARSNISRASNRSGTRPPASGAAAQPTVVEMDNEASDSDDDTAAGGVNGHLHPDHPLLARMQTAIADQLGQAEVKLDLAQRAKNAELSAMKGKREKYGVDLYSLQQKLAKLQGNVEKVQEQLQIEVKAKIDATNELKRITDEHANKVDDSAQLHQKWISQQRDLDQLNVTVRQVTEFIGKVKSEILVTRRAAYGTEDNMQKLEKDKKKQDELIDTLHERLKQMKEEIKLYDGQIAAQQGETKAAITTLSDAIKDMELIRIEQRDLLNKWKSALLGMANRDTALEAAEAALLKQQELLQTLDLERKGLKGTIKVAQNDNERLTGEANRLEAETKFVDGQLAALAAKRKDLNERYTMLRQDMERADNSLKNVKGTQRELKMSIDASHKSYEKLMQEKQKLDDQILENQSTQTTIEKGAQNVWKLAERLKAQTHEKEIKYGEIMNEVARIKVDSLNTGAHNKELKQTLGAYDKELREKDKLIEKYEMEIRQRHDKIEKKQIYIARLNKKFEALASNKQDDNTGPLEATIKNLLKEIGSVNKETGELSREWIKTQTELVSLVSQSKAEYDLVDELNSRETILNQKRLRVSGKFQQHMREMKQLGDSIKGMHTDLARLNGLIAKNAKLQDDLANSNYTMETDFMNKLKELELDSVKLDAAITRVKEEKESILQEIMEVEKQILLWEKKIQLERETQDALDPEYGQGEIKGMRKEIHRMKLRLQQLKRQQEKMCSEMERTVYKHDTIRVGVGTSTKEQKHVTTAVLNRKIGELKSGLTTHKRESKRVEGEIAEKDARRQELEDLVQSKQTVFTELEDKNTDVVGQIQESQFSQQMIKEQKEIYKLRSKRYDEAKTGVLKVRKSKEAVTEDLKQHEDRHRRLQEAFIHLQEHLPAHQSYFRRLATLT